jgi:aminopeptidase
MTDPYLPHHGDLSFDVAHYDLQLDYRPTTNALEGKAVLSVVLAQATRSIALDLSTRLAIHKVLLDGRLTRYRHHDDRLTVALGAELRPGTQCSVEIRYSGSPRPHRGPWGEVGWEELTDGVLVAGQPDGASTWFPCNDRPTNKASYRMTIRTASPYTVVANGELVERVTASSHTRWVYEQLEPMATYLATVQIGDYETSQEGPTLLLAPRRLVGRVRADTTHQPEMLALFERLFGPYPFAAPYTVVVTDDDLEIPLEAQGLSVFGANQMDGRGGSERLVAHELAHQWFGNSLTVQTWRDIWLHEGFACYAEWLWSEHRGGLSANEQARHAHELLAQLPQDLVLADPGPELMFDDRVYKRGALTLHALRLRKGSDVFFDLLRSWTALHRHGTVTTAMFRDHVDEPDLLAAWLDAPELPSFRPTSGAARRGAGADG